MPSSSRAASRIRSGLGVAERKLCRHIQNIDNHRTWVSRPPNQKEWLCSVNSMWRQRTINLHAQTPCDYRKLKNEKHGLRSIPTSPCENSNSFEPRSLTWNLHPKSLCVEGTLWFENVWPTPWTLCWNPFAETFNLFLEPFSGPLTLPEPL